MILIPQSRRLFLAESLLAATCVVTGFAQSQQPNPTVAARHAARMRKRRIIMNNDGNDTHGAADSDVVTPEYFLSKRTTPLAGTQVDAIFYCDGVFNLYTHRSDETEPLDTTVSLTGRARELFAAGTDSLDTIVTFCHAHGMEAFWSMRMNDTHDSGNDKLFCKWKRDHPEWLVGEKGKKYPYGCNRWSSVNYGEEAVREKVFRIFADVCARYEVDGIELDFFRHPVLFKEQMTGIPITDDQRAQMTALMRRLRAMTDSVAEKRGKPLMIAVRIPDSAGFCKAMGIDLETWLDEDLVDILTGADYFKLEPWENLAALAHAHGMPAYASLCERRIMGGGDAGGATDLPRWRGEALNAWKAGVDGIYTFNRFDPNDQLFRELGDPALLETLERVDQTSYIPELGMGRPDKWLKGGMEFLKQKQ